AQDDRARLAQPGDQERVAAVSRAAEGGRPGRGGQAPDVDVVLEQDGDAVQRAARAGGVLIAGGRLVQGGRADGDDRPEHRIEFGDPFQVRGGAPGGGRGPGGRSVRGRGTPG